MCTVGPGKALFVVRPGGPCYQCGQSRRYRRAQYTCRSEVARPHLRNLSPNTSVAITAFADERDASVGRCLPLPPGDDPGGSYDRGTGGWPATPLPRQPAHPSPAPAVGARAPQTPLSLPRAPRTRGFQLEAQLLGSTSGWAGDEGAGWAGAGLRSPKPLLALPEERAPFPRRDAAPRGPPRRTGGHTRSCSAPFSPRGGPEPRGRAECGAESDRGRARGNGTGGGDGEGQGDEQCPGHLGGDEGTRSAGRTDGRTDGAAAENCAGAGRGGGRSMSAPPPAPPAQPGSYLRGRQAAAAPAGRRAARSPAEPWHPGRAGSPPCAPRGGSSPPAEREGGEEGGRPGENHPQLWGGRERGGKKGKGKKGKSGSQRCCPRREHAAAPGGRGAALRERGRRRAGGGRAAPCAILRIRRGAGSAGRAERRRRLREGPLRARDPRGVCREPRGSAFTGAPSRHFRHRARLKTHSRVEPHRSPSCVSLTRAPSCFSLHRSPLFRTHSRLSPHWCRFTGLPSQGRSHQCRLTKLPHTEVLSPVPPHGSPVTEAALLSPELLQESPVTDLPRCVSLTRQPLRVSAPCHRSPLTDLLSLLSLPRAPFAELQGLRGRIRGLPLTCVPSLGQPRRNAEEPALSHLCAPDFNAILSDLPESVTQVLDQPAHPGRHPSKEGPSKG